MLAALMMIIAYCFLWSSFCDHLSVLSFLISQQLLNLQGRFGLAVSVLWLNPGFFFVCRSEDNFKDNSPHCVLPSCSLSLCIWICALFSLLFFLFLTLFFWVDFSALTLYFSGLCFVCSVFLG
ncbi:hypothetical protein Peur_013238 [Populus x canadensis]